MYISIDPGLLMSRGPERLFSGMSSAIHIQMNHVLGTGATSPGSRVINALVHRCM